METQIALINHNGWAVIGHFASHTGLFPHPMPDVDCPVVDTRPAKEDRVCSILRHHAAGPQGVADVDALIEELLDAGAECAALHSNSVFIPEQSCRVCQLAARKAYGEAIPFQLINHNAVIAD